MTAVEVSLVELAMTHLPPTGLMLVGGLVLGIYIRKLITDAPRTSRAQNGTFQMMVQIK